MGLINPNFTIEILQSVSKNTLTEHLGIEFLEIGKDYITAKMPVDHRTHQPFGLLHGGASVALAETLASIAATGCINNETQMVMGMEVNANHIRGVRSGYVIGKATPIHVGKKTHVWKVKITNDENELICISRLTLVVVDK